MNIFHFLKCADKVVFFCCCFFTKLADGVFAKLLNVTHYTCLSVFLLSSVFFLKLLTHKNICGSPDNKIQYLTLCVQPPTKTHDLTQACGVAYKQGGLRGCNKSLG